MADDPLAPNVLQFRTNYQGPKADPLDGGGGNNHSSGVDERVAKIEGSLEGSRHTQNILLGTLATFVAIFSLATVLMVTLGIFELQETRSLDTKVSAMPAEIADQIREITNSLANSITAAKQQPPQVILMQAPEPPAPPKK